MLAALATVKWKRARPMRKMGNFTVASHAPMIDALPIPDTTVVVAVPTNLMPHEIQTPNLRSYRLKMFNFPLAPEFIGIICITKG